LPTTPRLSIKEVIIKIEEHQKLKPGVDFSKHVIIREVMRKRIKGDKLAALPKNNTEYQFDVEIGVPSIEEGMATPKIDHYFNISHRVFHKLKIKIKFNGFRELTLVRDIEIKNSLSRE
ncbi:6643_t:CDS:1, partial [Acaulospora colombiana]